MKFSEWKKLAEKPDGWIQLGKLAAGENQDAISYLMMMSYCIRVFDDLHDQDRPVTHEASLNAIKLLFAVIPSNPFYQQHIKTLSPIQAIGWEAWERANELCVLTCTDRVYAHVFREQIVDVYSAVALLTQGYEKMVEVRRELENFVFSDSWMKSLEGTNVKLEYIPYVDTIQP